MPQARKRKQMAQRIKAMSNVLSYVDLVIDEPDSPEMQQEIMDDLFACLHSVNSRTGNSLGLDVPQLNTETASLGNVFRVFGDSDNLQKLVDLDQIQSMLAREEIVCGEVLPAPSVEQHVRLIRSRRDKRHGKGSIERVLRRARQRAIKRGEPLSAAKEMEWSNDLKSKQKHENMPGFNVRSTSNLNRYFVIIDRQVTEKVSAASFSGYGLSKDDGSIPLL